MRFVCQVEFEDESAPYTALDKKLMRAMLPPPPPHTHTHTYKKQKRSKFKYLSVIFTVFTNKKPESTRNEPNLKRLDRNVMSVFL